MTIDEKESNKFTMNDWWNENGTMSMLHRLNPLRLNYIFSQINQRTINQMKYKMNSLKKNSSYDERICHNNSSDFTDRSITNRSDFLKKSDSDSVNLIGIVGKKILDVGCGGGILSVPLARLGGNITGIDTSNEAIQVARNYSDMLDLNINFQHGTIEKILKQKSLFDIVVALEVIEHVNNPGMFLQYCWQLLEKNGLLFISSINRTIKSFLYSIVGAEYILKIIPKGMHNWSKFLSPLEIMSFLPQGSMINLSGIKVNITKNGYQFDLSKNIDINYIMCIEKH